MIFYVFSVLMDKMSTLTLLKTGGTEANPFVAWMFGISPWLWLLCDLIIFLAYYAFYVYMRDKVKPKTFIVFWFVAGFVRLSCCIWNYNQIRLHIWD